MTVSKNNQGGTSVHTIKKNKKILIPSLSRSWSSSQINREVTTARAELPLTRLSEKLLQLSCISAGWGRRTQRVLKSEPPNPGCGRSPATSVPRGPGSKTNYFLCFPSSMKCHLGINNWCYTFTWIFLIGYKCYKFFCVEALGWGQPRRCSVGLGACPGSACQDAVLH